MSQSEVPRAFHIMAKPSGSACNLNCDYCFFLEKEKLYPGSNFRMSEVVRATRLLHEHGERIRQLISRSLTEVR